MSQSQLKRGISQSSETMITKIRERERDATDSVKTTRSTRLQKIASGKEKAESLLKQMIQASVKGSCAGRRETSGSGSSVF